MVSEPESTTGFFYNGASPDEAVLNKKTVYGIVYGREKLALINGVYKK